MCGPIFGNLKSKKTLLYALYGLEQCVDANTHKNKGGTQSSLQKATTKCIEKVLLFQQNCIENGKTPFIYSIWRRRYLCMHNDKYGNLRLRGFNGGFLWLSTALSQQ